MRFSTGTSTCPLCGGLMIYQGLTSAECVGPINDADPPCPNMSAGARQQREERAELKRKVQEAFAGGGGFWFGP